MSNCEVLSAEATNELIPARRFDYALIDNVILLIVAPVLAACYLTYEYILAHYAGVVLGDPETAIFIMVGVMVMSAGLGSLFSCRVTCPYTGLAWLEAFIALLGTSSVLLIGEIAHISAALPPWLGGVDAISHELSPLAMATPYIIGFGTGFLAGMEWPLVVRVRERVPNVNKEHNPAIIYAVDCVGIAVATMLWALYLRTLSVTAVAATVACMNVVVGMVFLWRYGRHVRWRRRVIGLHAVVIAVVIVILSYGESWERLLTASFQNTTG